MGKPRAGAPPGPPPPRRRSAHRKAATPCEDASAALDRRGAEKPRNASHDALRLITTGWSRPW